ARGGGDAGAAGARASAHLPIQYPADQRVFPSHKRPRLCMSKRGRFRYETDRRVQTAPLLLSCGAPSSMLPCLLSNRGQRPRPWMPTSHTTENASAKKGATVQISRPADLTGQVAIVTG